MLDIPIVVDTCNFILAFPVLFPLSTNLKSPLLDLGMYIALLDSVGFCPY